MKIYKISKNERQHSTTPIVEVIVDAEGKTHEEFRVWVNLPKKQGDELSKVIVNLLNNYNE